MLHFCFSLPLSSSLASSSPNREEEEMKKGKKKEKNEVRKEERGRRWINGQKLWTFVMWMYKHNGIHLSNIHPFHQFCFTANFCIDYSVQNDL